MDKFDIATFCSLIQEYRVSQVYAAPPIVLHLVKSSLVNTYDLRTLRMITSGGASLASSNVKSQFARRTDYLKQHLYLTSRCVILYIPLASQTTKLTETEFSALGQVEG
jgi:Acyl-coenzyme A synthetases/AMP-(fatty) acid ligases